MMIRKEAIPMNSKYFGETCSQGLTFVNEAISKLEIKVTPETTIQELHCIHNAITAYAIDRMIEKLKLDK